MSVYEQPLSPFQDDLFLRATRADHALDEPAPQRPAGRAPAVRAPRPAPRPVAPAVPARPATSTFSP
jgi:hypothetical protein